MRLEESEKNLSVEVIMGLLELHNQAIQKLQEQLLSMTELYMELKNEIGSK